MKYTKLISKALDKGNVNSQIALAAVAGVAIGAVLVVLFAPASGFFVRKRIADRTKRLLGMNSFDKKNEAAKLKLDQPHFMHKNVKKPTSSIKELTSEGHFGEQPDETKA